MTQFVHLHVHSEYSVIDSTLGVKPLISLAEKAGQPAIALTDHSNLFALIKFYRAANGAGVKPLIGADVLIEDGGGGFFRPYCCVKMSRGT